MNSISGIDQMMAQMRLMAAQASGTTATPTAESDGFAGLLQDSLDKVSDMQKASKNMAEAFERGSDEYSLAEVMIAKQKAGIAFQATVQVRNKLLESYKDVMNMPI